MSYWVSLMNGDDYCLVDLHQAGGIVVVGGSNEATMSVTYNYGRQFHKFDFSIRDLHGKTGAETLSCLELIVECLGVERASDYWNPTEGNAGYCASVLASWARQHPQGVWNVN